MRRKIGMLLMAAALLLPAAVQAQVRFPGYQYQPPGFQPMAPGVGIGSFSDPSRRPNSPGFQPMAPGVGIGTGGVGIGTRGVNGWHTPGIPVLYDPLAGIRNPLQQGLQPPGIPDPYDPMARFHNMMNPPRDQFGLPVYGRSIPFPGDHFERPTGLSDPRFHPEDARSYQMGGPQIPTWEHNNATPPLQPINLPKFEFKPAEVKPSSPSSSGSYWGYGGIVTAILAALSHAVFRSRGPSSRDRE